MQGQQRQEQVAIASQLNESCLKICEMIDFSACEKGLIVDSPLGAE